MAEPTPRASTTPLTAHIYFAAGTAAEEQTAFLRGLRELDIEARHQMTDVVRSEPLTWLALVVLPFGGFLGAVGQGLAQDAYKAVKRLVGTAAKRGRDDDALMPAAARARSLLLEDAGSGARFVLEADLPDSAYEQLFRMDPASHSGRTLSFDRGDNRWR
ncbi:hypothetical protein [Streptomyces sp. NPDC001070]